MTLVVVTMILAVAVLALVVLTSGLAAPPPSAELSDSGVDYELVHERLFEPRQWARGVGTGTADLPVYNRPLEIDVRDDAAILPPPRPIRGVNNEA